MEIRLLGPLEVWVEGRPLDLGGSKRRALLAVLALHANEVVRTERLVDELWGERPPRNATGALHNHVSRLRKELGADAIGTRPWGYVLRVDESSIDLAQFEQAIAVADALPARERAAALRTALGLWRGRPLADVEGEPALQADVARLEELRVAALERRIDADLELGVDGALVAELESLVAEHPLRERLRGQLILALYRAGRQAEALEVYRETRRVLADELGLEPSAELRELERAILRQDPALAPPPRVRALEEPAARRHWAWFAGAALAGVALVLGGVVAAVLVARGGATHELAAAPASTVATTVVSASASTAGTASDAPQPTAAGGQPTRTKTRRPAAPAPAPRPTVPRPRRAPVARPVPAPVPPPARATPSVAVDERSPSLRISDDFAAGAIDPFVWHVIGRDNGATFTPAGGRIEIAIAPDAVPDAQWNQVGGHLGTRCRFRGDFDARVDFELLEWPADGNVYAGLNAIYANAAVVRQSSARWGDHYAAWVGSTSTGGVELADRSGRLRIRRVSGTVTHFVWHRGGWRPVATGRDLGAAVLAIQAQANGDEFSRMPVRVAFDNFVVTAPDADCPVGSDPRGP
jgi:DNA-binding SARP family transcriptional activator